VRSAPCWINAFEWLFRIARNKSDEKGQVLSNFHDIKAVY
jgi:hypothetical protein